MISSKYYAYMSYDEFIYEDQTYVCIKSRSNYLFVPVKIVKELDKDAKHIYVHREIFQDIVKKTTESLNNLCSLYF